MPTEEEASKLGSGKSAPLLCCSGMVIHHQRLGKGRTSGGLKESLPEGSSVPVQDDI